MRAYKAARACFVITEGDITTPVDCLFPGGVGRTTSPEDFRSLFTGVRDKVFGRLPDETWVYPGHGDDTTLGVERPHLDDWDARGW
jgi:glyoxylase-like metal-dependent hydrolase (beta-lactamase superfamily II)